MLKITLALVGKWRIAVRRRTRWRIAAGTWQTSKGEWFASRSGKLCCVNNADHCATRRPNPVAQHKFRRNITGISVAVDIRGAMLLPQDHQRHAAPLEFFVHLRPVGQRLRGALVESGVNSRRSSSASVISRGIGQVIPITLAGVAAGVNPRYFDGTRSAACCRAWVKNKGPSPAPCS
jgi:hypothetical protein